MGAVFAPTALIQVRTASAANLGPASNRIRPTSFSAMRVNLVLKILAPSYLTRSSRRPCKTTPPKPRGTQVNGPAIKPPDGRQAQNALMGRGRGQP